MYSFKRPLLILFSLVVAIFILGIAGYYIIEGWSFIDSIYMTAITLTTVGFREVRPLSQGGQIFTIVLLLLGVGAVAYTLSTFTDLIVNSDLIPSIRQGRRKRMIKKMNDHIIICGSGRVGMTAAAKLREEGQTVIVIDNEKEVAGSLDEKGITFIIGDATKDETLLSAGIERAKGLIACTGGESNNLVIVLSARALVPDLHIVARSADLDNEGKLIRAGANRVISPYRLGGRIMADILTRPRVVDFIGGLTLDDGLKLWLEEIEIGEKSELVGQTVYDADLRKKTGITLVALLRKETGATVSPDKNIKLAIGDVLFILGTREQLAKIAQIAGSLSDKGFQNYG